MQSKAAVGAGLVLAVVLTGGCSSEVVSGHPIARRHSAGPVSPSVRPAPSTSAAPTTGGAAQLSDPGLVRVIAADTRQDLIASQSYDYRTLEADRARALAHTTGPFRRSLSATLAHTVDPLARRLRATQSVSVTVVAIGSASSSQARLLVALAQHITQAARAPRIDPVTAQVTVNHVDGHWLISTLSTGGGGGPAHGLGSPGLDAALSAAGRGVADVITYRRASFTSDYARALAATTGTLRSDLVRRRAATLRVLRTGRFDLTGTVTGTGVVSVTPTRVVVLVSELTRRSDEPASPIPATIEATVVSVGGRWLLSGLQTVGAT